MPIRSQPYKHDRIDAYLAGLLPDDDAVRARWASQFDVADEPFALLSHMGLECAGAVQFVDPERRHLLNNEGRHEPVSRREIGDRLRKLRTAAQENNWTHPSEHWSLAGAQAKFTLALLHGTWHEAHGSAATTHIIKPGIRRMKYQAIVEFATMRVGDRLGLRTAQVELENFDGEDSLVVKRFDRLERGDQIVRLHQVDLCQAAGYHPRFKYEARHGPTGRQLASLLRSTSSRPEDDVRALSDALLFNYLSSSPDGHAKNMGLLLTGTQARFAPLYDLATAAPYGATDVAPKSAFSIGGVRNFGEAYPKHWHAHAAEFGLDPDERTLRAVGLAETIPDAFRDVLLGDIGGEFGQLLWRRMSRKAPNGAGRLLEYCSRVSPTPPSSHRVHACRNDPAAEKHNTQAQVRSRPSEQWCLIVTWQSR
jgi:serine/threonine-protein kinase HipA